MVIASMLRCVIISGADVGRGISLGSLSGCGVALGATTGMGSLAISSSFFLATAETDLLSSTSLAPATAASLSSLVGTPFFFLASLALAFCSGVSFFQSENLRYFPGFFLSNFDFPALPAGIFLELIALIEG